MVRHFQSAPLHLTAARRLPWQQAPHIAPRWRSALPPRPLPMPLPHWTHWNTPSMSRRCLDLPPSTSLLLLSTTLCQWLWQSPIRPRSRIHLPFLLGVEERLVRCTRRLFIHRLSVMAHGKHYLADRLTKINTINHRLVAFRRTRP